MQVTFRRLAVVVCLLAASAPSWGQQAPANPWVFVTTANVIPGSTAEFEDYLKKIQAARTKLAVPNAMVVYQTMLGGDSTTYSVLVTFTNWEDMDRTPAIPAMLAKAYGDAEGAKILKAGRSSISKITTEVYRLRLDLSTHVKPDTPPEPYATLTITEHNRDTYGSYMRILGKIKKAEEQDPAAPTVYRYSLVNGEGLVTVAARPSKTLADRGAGPSQNALMVKGVGQGEWDDMSETIEKSIARRSSVVMVYRPDLSTSQTAASSRP